MIQVTPQMKILVAVEPADFRLGIDGLANRCRQVLQSNPFCGWMFIFRNRRRTGVKVLVYDGQGFNLLYKRLSSGRFRYWPSGTEATSATIEAHELQVLMRAGNPAATCAAPPWRPVTPNS